MRPGPLSLVILAHVVVVGLLLVMERRFSPRRRTDGGLVYVLPITPVRASATAEPEPQPRPRQVRIPPAPATVQSPRPIQIEPQPINPPAPAPRIDWQREMERSVRESAQDGSARYRSLDSDPTPLELPQEDATPPQVYMLPNGDKVAKFRIGDRVVTCVSPQAGLDEHFAIWAQFRPSRCSSTRPGNSFLKPPPSRSAMTPGE